MQLLPKPPAGQNRNFTDFDTGAIAVSILDQSSTNLSTGFLQNRQGMLGDLRTGVVQLKRALLELINYVDLRMDDSFTGFNYDRRKQS